jgi:hypothetical protein
MKLRFGLWALLLAVSVVPAAAQANAKDPVQQPKQAASAKAQEPDLDDEAVQVMKALGDWLSKVDRFSVYVDVTADEVYPGETRVQRSYVMEMRVLKPTGFNVMLKGASGLREYAFDGKEFAVYYKSRNVLAVAPFSGTNEGAIGFAAEKLDVVVPLADIILGSKTYTAEDMLSAIYVGKTEIGGSECHHVLALMDDVDLQLWIDAGPEPMIRKFLLTYKSIPGYPQYSATLQRWDVKSPVDGKSLKLDAPQNAARVPFREKGE